MFSKENSFLFPKPFLMLQSSNKFLVKLSRRQHYFCLIWCQCGKSKKVLLIGALPIFWRFFLFCRKKTGATRQAYFCKKLTLNLELLVWFWFDLKELYCQIQWCFLIFEERAEHNKKIKQHTFLLCLLFNLGCRGLWLALTMNFEAGPCFAEVWYLSDLLLFYPLGYTSHFYSVLVL